MARYPSHPSSPDVAAGHHRRRPFIDSHSEGPATLASVGEFALIARVASRLRTTADVLLGPGDDAAVVRAPDGRVVVTTDVLVEGVHFRRDWSPAYAVGRKAAAQNLADVVAMGAVPTALVVALAAPSDLPVAWIDELTRGLDDEAQSIGAAVVGGDMADSDRLTISVTALGNLEGRAPVTRDGAGVGDVVVLAGTTGRAAAGLALLQRDDAALLERFGALVEAHRVPSPPYAAALSLARLGATAMVDISDGLAADAGHLAGASRIAIAFDAVPVAADLAEAAAALGLDVQQWLYGGGEDHAILATVPARLVDPSIATVVGRVAAGGGVWMAGVPLPPSGWQHFGSAR